MARTPSAVPAQSAVTSASDFVSLMAALANLNLSNGTTLTTTTTTTNSLHLPASSAGVGAPTLPATAASTTSAGSPSTTTNPDKKSEYFLLAHETIRTETAERVIGVPGNIYGWKNSYYDAVDIYHQAYNKKQVHVTPLTSSCFDVSIKDEWGSLD
ncbi:hypothetical protein IW262DRAFT_1294104 [Armillaria fumosa]|nr:hypothetical protein IW262DRAFT_1294104 [Armillaria fumosa]